MKSHRELQIGETFLQMNKDHQRCLQSLVVTPATIELLPGQGMIISVLLRDTVHQTSRGVSAAAGVTAGDVKNTKCDQH